MTATSWVPVPDGSPFPVQNLPYGVFSSNEEAPRVGVAIGEHVLDLAAAAAVAGLDGGHVFAEPSLNAFMRLGRPAWTTVREWLTEILTHPGDEELMAPHLFPMSQVRMHRPFEVGDYVDFFSSRQHAENLGRILRPDAPALPTAWLHLPIGYHGRAGTIVPTGTDVVRPCGQRRLAPDADPAYGPSTRLDFEAEVGFVVGVPSSLGQPVGPEEFAEHVFGVVLVNDWSARDIQALEYVPLGPFLGKSFATSISAWVVPLEALEPARVSAPRQDPPPLGYLGNGSEWGLDLRLEVQLNGTVVSRPPFSTMYWTPAQQLAHLTANGASLRTGDLFASGTVSGAEHDQRGSLVELTWNGTQPVHLADGQQRTFLDDGDTVTISAWAPGSDGVPIGLGPVTGTIRPALS